MKPKPPAHPYVKLTPRQFELLKKMLDEGEELLVDGRYVAIGDEFTSHKTFNTFLGYVLISRLNYGSGNGFERDAYYAINETGKRYLQGERLIYSVPDGDGIKTKFVEFPPLVKRTK